jgi:hypothetical protein
MKLESWRFTLFLGAYVCKIIQSNNKQFENFFSRDAGATFQEVSFQTYLNIVIDWTKSDITTYM